MPWKIDYYYGTMVFGRSKGSSVKFTVEHNHDVLHNYLFLVAHMQYKQPNTCMCVYVCMRVCVCVYVCEWVYLLTMSNHEWMFPIPNSLIQWRKSIWALTQTFLLACNGKLEVSEQHLCISWYDLYWPLYWPCCLHTGTHTQTHT